MSDGYLLDEMKLPGAVVDRDTKSPRYRDPANPANTWTGVGRRPKWLVELLEKGVDLDDLKIRERRTMGNVIEFKRPKGERNQKDKMPKRGYCCGSKDCPVPQKQPLYLL
ncbi:H-NS histone family protein [Enterobacter kobei]|uniref:H-NS histone family protein n=1 Tax=Enterobacter kobei TaxID=208224 RepID=UPI00388EE428